MPEAESYDYVYMNASEYNTPQYNNWGTPWYDLKAHWKQFFFS